MIPFASVPNLPTLFLRFVEGGARDFFPDAPELDAVSRRASELGGDGSPVYVTAGQQPGFWGGPLLTLTKALATHRLASHLSKAGSNARGIFWMAGEDHDLAEVARTTLPGPDGPSVFQLAGTEKDKSFVPAALVPVPDATRAAALLTASPDGEVARLLAVWSAPRTFGEAFPESLGILAGELCPEIVDPLSERFAEARRRFLELIVLRAEAIVAALGEVEARLAGAGYEPQVSRPEHDFPCYLIDGGIRKKLSFREGRFFLHGEAGGFDARGLIEEAGRRGALASPSALLRPAFASFLFPVAASILGPSEVAYHAQALPLFDVLTLRRPVLLPRPHLLPRGPRERRAMEALGISDSDLFRAAEAVRADPSPVSRELESIAEETSRRLARIAPQISTLDPTLDPVVAQTSERISGSIARLREKIDRLMERRDEEKQRRLSVVAENLTPGGVAADRVYSCLWYRQRFGPTLAAKLWNEAECRRDGMRFVEFE